MADLLSSGDWGEFNNAIGDLFDTFANIPLTIRRKVRNYSGYDTGSDESKTYTDVEIRCLGIFNKDGSTAENERNSFGDIELSEGYFLLYYQDLEEIGMVDASTKKPLINSTMDSGIFQGDSFTFIGDEQVGPFDDRYAVVKIHFKRDIKDV